MLILFRQIEFHVKLQDFEFHPLDVILEKMLSETFFPETFWTERRSKRTVEL